MKNKDLFQALGSFGFPLLEVQKPLDADALLTQISQSSQMRLLEGFPVVLANAAQNNQFDYNRAQGFLRSESDKSDFSRMLVMSLALYKELGLKFAWAEKLQKVLNQPKEYILFRKEFKQNKEFVIKCKRMSPERIKNIFNNYFKGQQEQLMSLSASKGEFSLEYSLAQIFSSKQKELFLKKFRGLPLNKTEKEYYSRTVRRKVAALANSELHKMATQLNE